MIRVWIHQIKPDKEWRLRDWLAQLNSRRDELRASFASATVRSEQAYVLPGADGPLLVYISEADDQDRAESAYDASTLPIDLDHRQVMNECVQTTLAVAPVYDIAF